MRLIGLKNRTLQHLKKQEELIKSIVIRYVKDNYLRIEFIVLLALVLLLVMRIPYINIFLLPDIVHFIILLSFLIIFKIKKRYIFLLSLVLFLIALFATLVRLDDLAEDLGNYVYFLLWTTFFYYFYDLWKEQ